MSRPSNDPLSGHGNVGETRFDQQQQQQQEADERATPPAVYIDTPTVTDEKMDRDHDYAAHSTKVSLFDEQPPSNSGGAKLSASWHTDGEEKRRETTSGRQFSRRRREDSDSENEEDRLKQVLWSLQTLAVNDKGFTPRPFTGSTTDVEKVERWLEHFKDYIEFRGIAGKAKIRLFRLLLEDQAADWLRTVPDTDDFDELLAAFRQRFAVSNIQKWKKATAIWTREQQPGESVDTFVTDMRNMARIVPIRDEEQLCFAIVKGLRGEIKLHVLQSAATTLEDVIKAARIAEAALVAAGEKQNPEIDRLTKQVGELIDQLKKSPPSVNTVTSASSRTPPQSPRRVRFDDAEPSASRRHDQSPNARLTSSYQQRPAPQTENNRSVYRPPPQRYDNTQWRGMEQSCGSCGRNHGPDRRECFAASRYCFNCKAIWLVFVAPLRGVLTPICSGGVRLDHDTRGARLCKQAASND